MIHETNDTSDKCLKWVQSEQLPGTCQKNIQCIKAGHFGWSKRFGKFWFKPPSEVTHLNLSPSTTAFKHRRKSKRQASYEYTCMYIYIYTHIYVYTYTHNVNTHIYIYIYIYIHTH